MGGRERTLVLYLCQSKRESLAGLDPGSGALQASERKREQQRNGHGTLVVGYRAGLVEPKIFRSADALCVCAEKDKRRQLDLYRVPFDKRVCGLHCYVQVCNHPVFERAATDAYFLRRCCCQHLNYWARADCSRSLPVDGGRVRIVPLVELNGTAAVNREAKSA